MFRKEQTGGLFAPIEAIKLDKQGVIKEFPDLKDNEDWKEIATKRFKEKLKKMKTEQERIDYVIEDLRKFGYKPLYLNKQGHRPKRIR